MPRMDIFENIRISKVLPFIQGRLLDIGCGYNNVVNQYGEGIGADIYPWEGINILLDKSLKLPFKSKVFDTVTIIAALNHIPNRLEAIKEVNRVLRNEGKLIITMIGPLTGKIIHGLFNKDERTRGGLSAGELPGMDKEVIKNVFSEGNFFIDKEIPFEFGLNRVYIAKKLF